MMFFFAEDLPAMRHQRPRNIFFSAEVQGAGSDSAAVSPRCRKDSPEEPEASPSVPAMDASSGSRGHPELCRRPCIYMRRAENVIGTGLSSIAVG